MMDSGTTYTYIISSEYRVLVSALKVALDNATKKNHVKFPMVTRTRVGSSYHIQYRNMIVTDYVPRRIWTFSP